MAANTLQIPHVRITVRGTRITYWKPQKRTGFNSGVWTVLGFYDIRQTIGSRNTVVDLLRAAFSFEHFTSVRLFGGCCHWNAVLSSWNVRDAVLSWALITTRWQDKECMVLRHSDSFTVICNILLLLIGRVERLEIVPISTESYIFKWSTLPFAVFLCASYVASRIMRVWICVDLSAFLQFVCTQRKSVYCNFTGCFVWV